MSNNINEKVSYLIFDSTLKTPHVNLYSLPSKCPICNIIQEPQPMALKYTNNENAVVEFRCVEVGCNSTYLAFYVHGKFGNKQYHFICTI